MSNSLNTFRKKLAGNEYASLTGAKRAIGKFREMSEDERNKARNLAEKHFEGAVALEGAPKKDPAKKSAAPKGRVPRPVKKAAAKRASTKDAFAAEHQKASSKPAARKTKAPVSDPQKPSNILTTVEKALDAAGRIQHLDKNSDVSNILELCTQGTEEALKSAMSVVGISPQARNVEAAPPDKAKKTEAAPADTNGTTKQGGPLPGLSMGALPGFSTLGG